MRRLLRIAALALALFVAFAVATFWAGEQTEVAVLRTFDAEGAAHDTKLWVVDDGDPPWVRVARPERHWFARLEGNPKVELVRHGVARVYRATPERDPETRARIDRLMAEKYGRTDWWYGILLRTQVVPVRLDPEPAPRFE